MNVSNSWSYEMPLDNFTWINDQSSRPPLQPADYILLIGHVLLLVFGLVGNGLVILSSLHYRREMLTGCGVFMISLSIGGLFFNLLFKPLFLVTMVHRFWLFGSTGCKLFMMAYNGYMFIYPLTLAMMAVVCCLNVRYGAFNLNISILLAFIMLVVVLGASTPNMLFATEIGAEEYKSCTVQWPDLNYGLSPDQACISYSFEVGFAIPTIIMIPACCYFLYLKNTNSRLNSIVNHTGIPQPKTLLPLLIALFLICWLPYWGMQFYIMSNAFSLSRWAIHLFKVAMLLATSNCTITPLVYIFMCKNPRTRIISVLTCSPRRVNRMELLDDHIQQPMKTKLPVV